MPRLLLLFSRDRHVNRVLIDLFICLFIYLLVICRFVFVTQIKTETVPLLGRSGILDEHQNNFFCGVCCGVGDRSDTVYAITESGLLCEFNSKRRLSKWVLLRVSHCLAVALLCSFGGNSVFATSL